MLALPINMIISWPFRDAVRWVLVDFNDRTESEALKQRLEKHIPASLAEGQLRYCQRALGSDQDKKWRGWIYFKWWLIGNNDLVQWL
jgi:hypothetical protein